MNLTLEVAVSSTRHPGDPGRHRFTEDGGTIGRAPGNSWVLPHNKVSGRHAVISFRSGTFYIQDVSRNGVSVSSPDNRLMRDRPYPLKAGDRIFIEPYEIDAVVDEGAIATPPPTRLTRVDPEPLPGPRPVMPRDMTSADSPFEVVSGDQVLDFLGPPPPVERSTAPRRETPPSPGDAHYAPPAIVSAPPAEPPEVKDIPPDYNPWDDVIDQPSAPRPRPGVKHPTERPREPSVAEPTPAPTPAPEPEPAPTPVAARRADPPAGEGTPGDLAAMLAGAGLDPAAVTPELMRSFGQILRVVVSGLIDVLQARQRIKSEFGMQQTMFLPSDNNPLKFSVNLEDALHNLLVKRNAAYLGPVEAFADAFDDLRDHQLAMLAGLRVAFDATLAELSPATLQQESDRQLSKGSLPLVSTKRRYWDLYREKHEEMARDPGAAFSRLFGEEFARAYEDQFRRLRADRKNRVPDSGRGAPDEE